MPPDAPSLIVMGASTGGVDALSTVVAGLPSDLDAAVLVVLHVPAGASSALPQILTRAGKLPALHGRDGQEIEVGRISVAPPDFHMLVEDGRVRLHAGPVEDVPRPSIDRLFTSAAEAWESDVVGVVLSGMLDDGTAGLITIRCHGGTTIVQDPDDAAFPSMPSSAVRFARPHHVVALDGVAPLLRSIVHDATSHRSDPAWRLAHTPGG